MSRGGARADRRTALARASAPSVPPLPLVRPVPLPPLPFWGTTFRSQTRSCTTHPYINMSSRRAARAKKPSRSSSVNPSFLPTTSLPTPFLFHGGSNCPLLAPSRNLPSSSRAPSNAGCVDASLLAPLRPRIITLSKRSFSPLPHLRIGDSADSPRLPLLVGVFVCSRRISRAIRHGHSRRAVL